MVVWLVIRSFVCLDNSSEVTLAFKDAQFIPPFFMEETEDTDKTFVDLLVTFSDLQ